jgi:hypothetical protein
VAPDLDFPLAQRRIFGDRKLSAAALHPEPNGDDAGRGSGHYDAAPDRR